jgi:tetratricopeptide (TPR) repeat protein
MVLGMAAIEAELRKSSPMKQAELLMSLGESQRKQKKLDDAEDSIKLAMGLVREAKGESNERYGQCLEALAGVEEDRGNYPQAQQYLQESIKIEEKRRRPDPRTLARRRQRLAMAFHLGRNYAEAAPHFAKSLELYQQAYGAQHEETGRALAKLGEALAREGKHPEAIEKLRKALWIEERTAGHDSPGVAEDLLHLAMSYEKVGELDAAVQQLERLALLRERLVAGSEFDVGVVFYHLARLHFECGRLGRAQECALTAVPMLQQSPGPELALALETLADIYSKSGRSGDVPETRERARLVWESLGLRPPPGRGNEAAV